MTEWWEPGHCFVVPGISVYRNWWRELLLYPLYWDPVLNGYTSCEAVLRRIIKERDALMAQNGLMYQRLGYCRRQWLKLNIIYRSFIRKNGFPGERALIALG